MNVRTAWVAGGVAAIALGIANPSSAQALKAPLAPLAVQPVGWVRTTPALISASVTPTFPEALSYENRYYAWSTAGLRDYLESIRAGSPELYARLDPELARLESRKTIATGVLIGGAAVALVSVIYAFAPVSDCTMPNAGDPNFSAASDAWDQCSRDRYTRMATFSLIGLGAFGASLLGSWAIAPSRSDMLSFISSHNQINPTPLRLQVAFDPSRSSAFAGAQISF
jgi:hypothetical protein